MALLTRHLIFRTRVEIVISMGNLKMKVRCYCSATMSPTES